MTCHTHTKHTSNRKYTHLDRVQEMKTNDHSFLRYVYTVYNSVYRLEREGRY